MLATTIVEHDPAAEHLLALIDSVAAWRRPPSRWSGGRAGWIDLADEALGRGIKLKGLGTPHDPEGRPGPPVDEHYDRWSGEPPDPHLGFEATGELCLLEGDPAPIGGLVLVGARREQACARSLTDAGVPCVRPAAAIRFDDLAFTHRGERHPLGLSATVCPVEHDHRTSVTVPFHHRSTEPEGAAERARLRRALDLSEARDDAEAQLDLLAATYRAFGSTLRGFSAAGWYRYSGHPDNVAIDDDGRAVLVDLDSCRPTRDSPAGIAALEEVRDGMSALYNLSCAFYSSASVRDLDDAALVSHEPFSAFLDGWDPDSLGTNVEPGRALAAYVVAARRRLRRFARFLSSPSPEGEHLYRYVRHDRDLTFSWVFRQLYRRRLERPHAHPMPFGMPALDERLLRFAGRARFAELTRLTDSA